MIHRVGRRTAFVLALAAAWLMFATHAVAAPAKIVFHDKKAAANAILDDDDDPYFELLQSLEMSAKSGSPLDGDLAAQRNAFRSRYSGSVLDFSNAEKKMIRSGIERVHPYLEKHYSVLAGTTWSFIKVTPGFESGLPHTRGDHIVLSELFLQWLLEMPEDNSAPFLSGLLVHELMHVAQRDHAEIFDALYSDIWGFREVAEIAGDAWFVENQVINPDGPHRWLYPAGEGDNASWLWTTLLLQSPESGNPSLTRDMQMIAVTVDELDGAFSVRQAEGKPVYGQLMEASAFTDAFSYTTNLYHPNEITADALAKLVVAGMFGVDAPSGNGLEVLREWFDNHLHANSDN